MAGILNKYQVVGPHFWNGLTKDNHLGSLALQGKKGAQLVGDFMIQLLAYQRGPTVESRLNQLPKREFDTDDEYEWKVIGSSRRNIPLIEARNIEGEVIDSNWGTEHQDKLMIGANKEPFYLVFPENYFFLRDTIVGNLNELYPMIVLENAVEEGTNCLCKVELSGGNTEGIPYKRLLAGEKFSIEAPYSERELSRQQSDIHFAAPVTMRNEFSRIRKHHKVPGTTMLNKQIACGLPVVDKAGKTHVETVWMHYVDWEFEQEFSDNKNNALMFGRSNRNKNGKKLAA